MNGTIKHVFYFHCVQYTTELRADRWPSALSYLALMAALCVMMGFGRCLFALRRPTACTMYLLRSPYFGVSGTSWFVWSDLIREYYPVFVAHRRGKVCPRQLFLLASRIKGYDLRRFSSTSWGNCSFNHILLPFSFSGTGFRTSSRSLKILNLAKIILCLVLNT